MSDDFDIDKIESEGTVSALREEVKAMLKKYGFNSCRIIATRIQEDTSRHFSVNAGCYYASYGATKLWVKRQEDEASQDDDENDIP